MATAVRDTIAQVAARAAEIEAERERAYQDLIERSGSGGEIIPEEVIRVCAGASKTLDEFQEAAERVSRRIELRKAVARVPALRAEWESLEAEHKAELTAFHTIMLAHNAKCHDLHSRKQAITEQIAELDKAQRELSEPPAHLAEKLAALRKERLEAQKRRDRLTTIVNAHKHWMNPKLDERDGLVRTNRDSAKANLPARERELAGWEEKMGELARQIAAVEAEILRS
jgi:chromosome segregation ATPase